MSVGNYLELNLGFTPNRMNNGIFLFEVEMCHSPLENIGRIVQLEKSSNEYRIHRLINWRLDPPFLSRLYLTNLNFVQHHDSHSDADMISSTP